ncbi:unnamed protein product [Effrenium voratum]|uniref:GYF domain-containing protein n=1 Tax=Effrenium voratum TaxID=2562239 RepID=A0AA36I2Q0_9DINO|nr:unnamed protein product [Effrenium voratum]
MEAEAEWYFQEPITRQPAGPWTITQMRTRWQRDQINGLTPVWRNGMPSWRPIAELPELKEALREAVEEERPPKRRRTLEEVPITHTYTSDEGQLYMAAAFCEQFGLRCPVIMAPMAGSSPVALASAVASGGGMGACGVLAMSPEQIAGWAAGFRAAGGGPLQMNTWVPDPPPARDADHEQRVRDFLGRFGPAVPSAAGDAQPQNFDLQMEAMIEAEPAAISSIMGVFPEQWVRRLQRRGIRWLAVATTVREAQAAEAAGADAIVAQGMEAGGHRGAFRAERAESELVGLFALVPAIAEAVKVPVIATGGIGDPKTAAAALVLGASAVQVGTALLRCPEAKLNEHWAEALAQRPWPEDTAATRAFSGRLGRSLRTAYVQAAEAPDAPRPAPYPVQRGLTKPMLRCSFAGPGEDAERRHLGGHGDGLGGPGGAAGARPPGQGGCGGHLEWGEGDP